MFSGIAFMIPKHSGVGGGGGIHPPKNDHADYIDGVSRRETANIEGGGCDLASKKRSRESLYIRLWELLALE